MFCLTGKGSAALPGLFGPADENGKSWVWVLTGAPVAILYTERQIINT